MGTKEKLYQRVEVGKYTKLKRDNAELVADRLTLLDALTRIQDASANQGVVIEIARAAIAQVEKAKS